MPASHDTKPRNAHRHADVTKRTRGLPIPSKRSANRRMLRRIAMGVAGFEVHLRAVLANENHKWRHYERADRDEAQRIRRLAMARLRDQLGLREAAA